MASRMLKKLAEEGGYYNGNVWGCYYFEASLNIIF
jgi:hypothetical protein